MGGSLTTLAVMVRVDDQGLELWQVAILTPVGVAIAYGILWLLAKLLPPPPR